MVSPALVRTGVATLSAPVTTTPARSSAAIVLSRPSLPASRAWLFAMLPITVPAARRFRSAGALDGGARNAKQLVDRALHFDGARPAPIADSTFTSTRSA